MPAIVTTPTKTAGGVLLAITNCVSGSVTVGNWVDVSGKLGPLDYFIKLGRTAATALTANVNFRIEASSQSSGNDEAVPIAGGQFTSNNGLTAAQNSTLNGATTAGNTTLVLTSGSGFAAGNIIYEKEATLANSEFSRVKGVVTNTLTLEEAQTRSHTNGINVASLAEEIHGTIDIAGKVRIRLVVDCATSPIGTAVDIKADYTSQDSVSSV